MNDQRYGHDSVTLDDDVHDGYVRDDGCFLTHTRRRYTNNTSINPLNGHKICKSKSIVPIVQTFDYFPSWHFIFPFNSVSTPLPK